jgi:hypothetical protein
MDIAIKLFIMVIASFLALISYFFSFTKSGQEVGWEMAQIDPIQRRFYKNREEFVKTQRLIGYFAIPFCAIILCGLVYGIIFPI